MMVIECPKKIKLLGNACIQVSELVSPTQLFLGGWFGLLGMGSGML